MIFLTGMFELIGFDHMKKLQSLNLSELYGYFIIIRVNINQQKRKKYNFFMSVHVKTQQ